MAGHDKKLLFSWLIRLKGNLRHTSRNSLSSLFNKDQLSTALLTLLTKVRSFQRGSSVLEVIAEFQRDSGYYLHCTGRIVWVLAPLRSRECL